MMPPTIATTTQNHSCFHSALRSVECALVARASASPIVLSPGFAGPPPSYPNLTNQLPNLKAMTSRLGRFGRRTAALSALFAITACGASSGSDGGSDVTASRVKVRTVASGLEVPWGIDFLPNGDALVAERTTGQILRIPKGGGTPSEAMNVPGSTSTPVRAACSALPCRRRTRATSSIYVLLHQPQATTGRARQARRVPVRRSSPDSTPASSTTAAGSRSAPTASSTSASATRATAARAEPRLAQRQDPADEPRRQRRRRTTRSPGRSCGRWATATRRASPSTEEAAVVASSSGRTSSTRST